MAFDTSKQQQAAEALLQKAPAPAPIEAAAPPAHPLATVSPAPAAAPVHAPAPAPAPEPGGFAGAHPAAAPPAHFEPTDPKMKKIYDANQGRVDNAKLTLSKTQQSDMKQFEANYAKHKADYDKVAQQSDLPPELIAALHWRESTGNFKTYLAQGDPLGKPAVHIPRNQPVRSDWDLAAEDALGASDKRHTQKALDLHQGSTDTAAMATYAEYYNGLGYANRGKPSPYVFSGTDQYTSGKYVADGKYNPNVKDSQLGVMSMVQDLMDKEKAQQAAQKPPGT